MRSPPSNTGAAKKAPLCFSTNEGPLSNTPPRGRYCPPEVLFPTERPPGTPPGVKKTGEYKKNPPLNRGGQKKGEKHLQEETAPGKTETN